MDALLNAEIIKAAAASPLGILSLMCLIVAVVALAFFRKAPMNVRLGVFALLLLGVAGFAYALLAGRSAPSPQAPTAASAPPAVTVPTAVPSAPPPPSASGDCFAERLAGLRSKTLEEGSVAVTLLAADEDKAAPVALRFTEAGVPLGALVFSFFEASQLFKLTAVLDAQCQPVADYANISRGGSRNSLQNWDSVEIAYGSDRYQLRLAYNAGEVSAGYFRRVSARP